MKDKPLTPEAIKALFREWTADYAAAKVRDEKGEAAVGQVRLEAPEKTRDEGIER